MMMMTLDPIRTRALAALLLLSALLAVWAAPAPAGAAPARWTIAPAANDYGAGRKDYGYTLSAGGRIEDAVVVANQGDAPLRLVLRPAGAVSTASGRFGLVDPGARPAGVPSWVTLGQRAVTLAPGEAATVPFVLAPPKGAAAGDHVGGIVAAPAGSDVDRGVPIRLRVSGPLKPALAVGDVHLSYSGTASPLGTGDATVSYTIRNTGNAILAARQAVEASGPFGAGSRAAARMPDSPPLLPGGTWRVSEPLRDVAPALRLKATVTLTPLLADAAGSIAPLAATSQTGGAWAVPWTLLVVLALVAGAAVVGVRRMRRRHRTRPAAQAVGGVAA